MMSLAYILAAFACAMFVYNGLAEVARAIRELARAITTYIRFPKP